jgi:hypothetical protein
MAVSLLIGGYHTSTKLQHTTIAHLWNWGPAWGGSLPSDHSLGFFTTSTDSVDSCQKTEPREQRSLTLYTLASRLQKQKARSNPYMVIFNFIGYFILMLHDFSHVQISQVLSLCYAVLTSLLLSQDSGIVCFLLILLSVILFPTLMLRPT